MAKKHPPMRDRRDVGTVVFPIEKMLAARERHSCCVAVEAALEVDADAFVRRLFGARRRNTPNTTTD